VVCREGNRQVGIAVSHVLDVAAGNDLFEAGSQHRAGGVTLLNDHVTGIVDLGAVPPLPSRATSVAGLGMERSFDFGDTRMSAQQATSRTLALRKGIRAAAGDVFGARRADTLFGMPITHILEIVGGARPQPVPLAPEFVGGLVHYRGDVLTTVSLRQLLGMPSERGRSGKKTTRGRQDILVLESSGGCFGLLVDSVGEVLTVSSADHEPNPSILDERRSALFAGAYKLKEGLLVMLDPERLDPMRLEPRQHEQPGTAKAAVPHAAAPEQRSRDSSQHACGGGCQCEP
jgi:purine-binding chemotaxis protein CheW